MSIKTYGRIKITISEHYSPKGIDNEGKVWSIHNQSFMKNDGPIRRKRYVRAGMVFEADIIEDWRQNPRGEYQGVVRFVEK